MFSTPTSPRISIIMPTYNRVNLISESIQSIRNQTYSNWELIIVDDGSDDHTEQVVKAFEDDRIEFIKAGRIGVGGRIKNIGLQQAQGEVIAFLDSDDLWAPTKLEKQIQALDEFQDAGFSLTNGYNFRIPGQPINFFYKERRGIKYGNVHLDYFKSQLPAFTQALLVRKECVFKVGLFKEEKAFSDADFIISLALQFNAVILYEPLVYRRLHDVNWSDPNWIASYKEGIQILEEHKNDIPLKIYRHALFRLNINFGESYLSRNDKRNSVQKFVAAWKQRPVSMTPVKKIIKAWLKV